MAIQLKPFNLRTIITPSRDSQGRRLWSLKQVCEAYEFPTGKAGQEMHKSLARIWAKSRDEETYERAMQSYIRPKRIVTIHDPGGEPQLLRYWQGGIPLLEGLLAAQEEVSVKQSLEACIAAIDLMAVKEQPELGATMRQLTRTLTAEQPKPPLIRRRIVRDEDGLISEITEEYIDDDEVMKDDEEE